MTMQRLDIDSHSASDRYDARVLMKTNSYIRSQQALLYLADHRLDIMVRRLLRVDVLLHGLTLSQPTLGTRLVTAG